ncbi:MAG TPA: hypothetical protein VF444_04625 [Pseudonocardiaceae bacterium]
MLVDELDYRGSRGSSSRAKKADANFTFSNLEYQALSNLDGYPTYADFVIPCTETAGFVRSNHLAEVASEWDLPSVEDLDFFAIDHEWRDEKTQNSWYERPAGSTATLQILVAESSSCHVYLTAVDHY